MIDYRKTIEKQFKWFLFGFSIPFKKIEELVNQNNLVKYMQSPITLWFKGREYAIPGEKLEEVVKRVKVYIEKVNTRWKDHSIYGNICYSTNPIKDLEVYLSQFRK